MITVLPLLLCVIIYAYKLGVLKSGAFCFNIFIAAFIATLSFFEGEILTPDFYFIRLDESTFYRESITSLNYIVSEHWRYLGYILYSHLTYITGGEFLFKIQSIPFALLSSLVLYDLTKNKLSLWLFPIFFSYIFFLSTLHMRDSMIIFGVLYFVLQLSRCHKGACIIGWTSLAILYFITLRLEFAIIFFLVGTWILLVNKLKFNIKTAFIYPPFILIVLFIIPYTTTLLIEISNYFFPGRAEVYLLIREEEVTSFPLLNANASSFIRQIITPIPTSLLIRVLGSEIPVNLYLSDLFRFLIMIFVYTTISFLLVNFWKAYNIFIRCSFIQILLIISVIVSIVYSIYGDGGGDSRNKIYPYLFLFILLMKMVKIK